MSVLIVRVCIAVAIFCFGYILGAYNTRRRINANAREIAMDLDHLKQRVRTFGRGPLPVALACIALVGVGVQVSISAGQANRDDEFRSRQVECLNQYANELYDSLQPRQAASEKLQAADRRFKKAVALLFLPHVDPKVKEKRLRSAVVANLHLSDQLSRERASNPYPQPPRKVCRP